MKHEELTIFRVRLNKPFSDFFVQIEPTDRTWENGKRYHDMILCADGSTRRYLFCSTPCEDVEELTRNALIMGPTGVIGWLEEQLAVEEY